MKKIMGHVTGKLSLSILTMFVLLVGVLAGLDTVTTTKASKSTSTANSTSASPVTATNTKATNINPAAKTLQAAPKDLQTARELAKKQPLVFEPNRGQSNKEVQFFARSSGYAVFMKSAASAVLQFRRNINTPAEQVTMKLSGANEKAPSQALEATGGTSNYHIGNDRAKWLEAIPNYTKVRYNNVYAGVDVIYQGDGKNFRHDFVVQPGADPKSIHLSYEGGRGTTVDASGRLSVALSQGSMTASKPYIYQEYNGSKHEVSGGYVLTAQNDAQFEVGSYDHSKALVIDPGYTYAAYSLTAGDAFETQITGVGLSSTAEMICGWTFSPTLDSALTGGQQIAFIGSASATTLASTKTFVGGTTGNTQANGCAMSTTGATAMVGVTNSGTTFPGAATLLTPAATGVNFNKHGFIVSGAVSGLIAGNGSDVANAVAFDKGGNIHVVGATSSGSQGSPLNNLLTAMVPAAALVNAAQKEFESHNSTNAYYLEFKAGAVAYGTFLGGFNTDEANAVATDASGNAYITGDSTSWGRSFRWENFPIQPAQACSASSTIGCIPTTNPPTAPVTPYTFNGGKHAWIAAINPAATNTVTPTNGTNGVVSPTLLYALPIGGDINPNEQDIGTAITVDINYNVYVGGNTQNPSLAGLDPRDTNAPAHPGTNNSLNNVVFTAPGVICPSPLLNLTNDLESSVQNCTALGNAAGPGVVAAFKNLSGGNGYAAGDIGRSITFSLPDLAPLGGTRAQGIIGTVSGGSVTSLVITNQGTGYTTPPTVTIPAPLAGGTAATANVVVGVVVLGNPSTSTGIAQDGWVIQLNAPGLSPGNQVSGTGVGQNINNTFNFNGGTLRTATPVYAQFPAFVFATLVNGDEVNGNGTGGAVGVNPANTCVGTCPANNVNQVTGIVTDYGAIPGAVVGSAGPLGNIYISGSSSSATGGSLRTAFDAVLIRRRINANAADHITGNTLSTNTQSPFAPIYTAAEAGVVNNLGDLDLGLAVPAGGVVASPAIPTNAITAVTLTNNPPAVTVKLTVTTAPPAGLIGKNVTVSGITLTPPLTTVTSAATPFFTGTGTIYTVTFTTPTLAPLLAVGQAVTLSGSANANYNVASNVLGPATTPSAPAPTATTFTLAFSANPGAFADAAGTVHVDVANGYNGSFAVTAESTTSPFTISYVVTTNPGIANVATGNAATPAITAVSVPAPIGTATGVGYDPATGRSCIGGWTGTSLPSSATAGGIFMPPPLNAALFTGSNTFVGTTGTVPPGFGVPEAGFLTGFLPNANNAVQPGEIVALNSGGTIASTALAGTTVGTVTEGILACALYTNDVTLTSSNPVISFQMIAGETALSTPALSTINILNQTTISITNPNSVAQAATAGTVWYTPPPFGGSSQGPASASSPFNQWLHLDTTPGGTSFTLSLLNPLNPQEITPASRLDPGFYQATFKITPSNGAGDNAGVPIIVTVNLTVTGTVLTNTVFAGGVPTPNAGPAPVGGAPVVLNEGSGWADVGNNTEYINIPVAAQVPLLSPSASDIVFDLLRDSNGNPVYTNSSTQWPVLGPPSTGGVQSLNITSPGSNYTCSNGNSVGTPGNCTFPLLFCVSPPSATTQTCGAPTGGTQAQGTFNVDPTTGTVLSYTITNAGSGYSNPPYVIFPLPNAGGTQAQALVAITTAPGTNPGGGFITLHPIQFGPFGNLIPGAVGCGQTPFAIAALPDGLTNSSACYIQAQLPPTMLAGAPTGTYSGTFYLYVNSGQLNIPSFAPLTLPGGTTITFSPVGSSGSLPNCPVANPGCNPPPGNVTPVAVTINVLVNPGTMTIQSPWISNVNPAIPAPPFVLNPSILPPVPLAPFSVPVGYTGTITSNNNGLPYIPGITGNTVDFHTLRLDSRNLLTGNTTGTFLATVTPGISQAASIALALSATPPSSPGNGLSSVSLPINTCTVTSPPIPSSLLGTTGILQFTHDGILQAASAPVTTTDVTISIVNPSTLAAGYYASTLTFAALGPNGQPITNNNNQPIQASIPVCLSVGNRLAYEYQVVSPGFAAGNVLVSGQPTTGMLFMEAGTVQTLEADVYGLGPSQNVNLPLNVKGGPQFAPPDSTLQIPALFSMLTGTPSWIAPTLIQPAAGTPFVGIEGGTNCNGTQPNNTCTPAAQQLVIAPPQATSPGTYPNPLNLAQFPAGGITVTDTPLPTQPLLAASNSPMNAVLPVTITSGPGMLYSLLDPSSTACNGTQPNGPSCGTVFQVLLSAPGFGGSGYLAPPNITFQGGHCAAQPTAVATIAGGSVNAIFLTSLGGGCQTAPIVNIDPPTTPGGAQATAIATVSDGTINLNFTEVVGSLSTSPSSETITVLPSRVGTTLGFFFPLPSLQSPTNPLWLAFGFSSTGCIPFVQFDPTQSQAGFFNGCSVSVSPNLLAASLPPGTYQAWQVLQSGPLFPPYPQPHYVTVLVTLTVVPQGQTCSISLRDSGNGNSSTLPYTGTAMSNGAQNGGFYPSTGLNLTVTPSATCSSSWTVTMQDTAPTAATPSTVLSLASPATGSGVGTLTFNMQANTHLVPRTSTITVTAGLATATYTVSQAASTLSQLQREVEALYQRSLGREPDTGGYNFWTCTTPLVIQPCANLGIAGLGGMVDLFLGSSSAMGLNAPLNSPPGQASVGEGESSDFQVLAIYKGILGRTPSFVEWSTAVAPFRLNETPAGWALAATTLLNSLTNSQEYATKYGPPSLVSNEVTNLYVNLLGRQPSGTELTNGITLVTNGGVGGLYNLFYNLAIAPPLSAPAPPNPPYPASADTSAEFQNRGSFASASVANDHSNSLFLSMLYYSILGRDADAGGFNFWLSVANGGGAGIYFQGSNITRVLVEGPGTPNVGLVGSTEFQNTFNF